MHVYILQRTNDNGTSMHLDASVHVLPGGL